MNIQTMVTFNLMLLVLQEDELEENQPRLLSTDNALVVPINKNIKNANYKRSGWSYSLWAMPSLRVKMDAIPGRLNETYFRIEEPGMYYGQCSGIMWSRSWLCAIMIKAVSDEDFSMGSRSSRRICQR